MSKVVLTYRNALVENCCMLGRVLTYQKCPICKKPFTVLPDEKGIICEEHRTVPTRYYINANKLKAGRIYSDPQGNPFDSYRVALRQLESMRRDYDNKIFNPDDWIPGKAEGYRFENLVAEWLRGYEIEVTAGTKTKKYVRILKQFMRDYLLPEFQKVDVREIRELQIKKFYQDLLEKRVINPKSNKKLSHKTIKHILDTLRAFLKAHKSIIKVIPDLPKFTVLPCRGKRWIGIEKQMAALSHIPEGYQLAFELLFDTGMRPGELRALKKQDLRDGYITVERAFSENSLRQRTKTGVEITHKVSFSLYKKLIQHTNHLTPDDFIFTKNGKPYHVNEMYRIWKITCKKAGIEYITLYQASRHSIASQIRQRKDLEAIEEAQEKLGHTNKLTTRKNYILHDGQEIK